MRKHAHIPLMLGVALALGVWLGSGLVNPFAQNGKEAGWNRVEQILQYVESEYVDTVSREALEQEIVAYLLQRLDPHSRYISDEDLAAANEPLEGGFEGIGVQFNLRGDTIYVVNTIPNGPAAKAGLHPGDLIVSVDSQLIAGTGLTNKMVTKMLKGAGGSTVNVGVRRQGHDEILNYSITRGTIPILSIDAAYLKNDSTIYVKIAQFSRTTYEEFVSVVYPLQNENVKHFILDLRGNGGGYLDAAVSLIDEFLAADQLITYTEGKSRPRKEYRSTANGQFLDVNLVVIIDGFSASASEIFAGATQDLGRGLIVGKRSYGKGLVQEQSEWGDGSATRLTVARYYTPKGRSIQRPYDRLGVEGVSTDTAVGGIMPDIEVSRDTAGITWLFAELVHSGHINRFAYEFRDQRIDAFLMMTADSFEDAVSDAEIEEALRTYLKRQKYEMNEREWRRSSALVLGRIRAVIARSLFGDQAYYQMINEDDAFVKTAIEALRAGSQTKKS